MIYIWKKIQIKKGPLVNLRGGQGTLSRSGIPVQCTHLSTKYPPPPLQNREDVMKLSWLSENDFSYFVGTLLQDI